MKSSKSLEKDASKGNIMVYETAPNQREAPVTDTNRKIFTTTGAGLQFITHSNGDIMKFYEICQNFDILCGDEDDHYHMTLVENILRLAAAHNNQRTRDAIDALAAAGAVPGEYYTGESKRNRENSILRIENDDDGN